MKKIFAGLFVGLLAVGVVLTFSALAAKEGEKEDPEGKVPDKLTDKDWKDLARTAFVVKDSKGKEWLYIRLSSNQYALSKVGVKSHGPIRIVLHPRQKLAVRHALKLDQPVDKVVLRTNAKHLHFSKGLKSHYIVRSAPDFKKLLLTPTKEEKQEPANQPDHNLVENIKSTS